MADIDSLLKEADELGILSIDVFNIGGEGKLSVEAVQVAIDTVKRHRARKNDAKNNRGVLE